ncbi:MAG TPA: hypothetical protein VFC53_12380 [Dehalococcoidia bacterium]|nr:hypothetical protein [Dehalococcoidia bacterium]
MRDRVFRRLIAFAPVAAAALASVALLCGCGVKDRITGASGPTRTPTVTPTTTPTPSPTPSPTPTATPTPALPANPRGLHRWDRLPVHYCIDESGAGYVSNAELRDFVGRAFGDWGVAAVDDGACAGPVRQDDDVNEIGWGTPPGATPGGLTTEAGATLTTFQECQSGCDPDDPVQLIEADIIIEGDPPRIFRTRDCLYSTVLHETGHFLGIDHQPAPSVMQAETSDCPTELTPVDRAALRERYGARAR